MNVIFATVGKFIERLATLSGEKHIWNFLIFPSKLDHISFTYCAVLLIIQFHLWWMWVVEPHALGSYALLSQGSRTRETQKWFCHLGCPLCLTHTPTGLKVEAVGGILINDSKAPLLVFAKCQNPANKWGYWRILCHKWWWIAVLF